MFLDERWRWRRGAELTELVLAPGSEGNISLKNFVYLFLKKEAEFGNGLRGLSSYTENVSPPIFHCLLLHGGEDWASFEVTFIF